MNCKVSTKATSVYSSSTSSSITITVSSYIYYNTCSSSDKLSDFGSSIYWYGSSAGGVTFNSTETAYDIYCSGGTNQSVFIPITALAGKTNITVTAKCRSYVTSTPSHIGLAISNGTAHNGTGVAIFKKDNVIQSSQIVNNSESNNNTSLTVDASKYYDFIMITSGTNVTFTISLEGNQIYTITKTISSGWTNLQYGFYCENYSYIKQITAVNNSS